MWVCVSVRARTCGDVYVCARCAASRRSSVVENVDPTLADMDMSFDDLKLLGKPESPTAFLPPPMEMKSEVSSHTHRGRPRVTTGEVLAQAANSISLLCADGYTATLTHTQASTVGLGQRRESAVELAERRRSLSTPALPNTLSAAAIKWSLKLDSALKYAAAL